MFDIGWSEILVVVVITILVVGPKELPGLLRTIGKTVGNLRRMAGDFQHQFNDALKEAELDEVQKTIGDVRTLDPGTALKDAVKKQLSSVDDLTEDLSAQMASSKRDINEALETGSASALAIDDRSMVPPELEQLHSDANIVSDADAQSQPDMGKTKKAD